MLKGETVGKTVIILFISAIERIFCIWILDDFFLFKSVSNMYSNAKCVIYKYWVLFKLLV